MILAQHLLMWLAASKSSACQTIVERVEKPKICLQIINYRSDDQPFSKAEKPLNFIQESTAVSMPQELAKRSLLAGFPHRKAIIRLIPLWFHIDREGFERN